LLVFEDHHVALEQSTTKPISIDIEKFLQHYPNYSSIYQSWQRLDDHMQVRGYSSIIKYFHFYQKGKETTTNTLPTTFIEENSEEISVNEDNDDSDDDLEFRSNRRKYKRHVGPHDNGGLQRTISTGI
jgi:hypothetical protein